MTAGDGWRRLAAVGGWLATVGDCSKLLGAVGDGIPLRQDPELPFSLEQLGVVEEARIAVAVERRPGPGFPSGYGTVSISLHPALQSPPSHCQ